MSKASSPIIKINPPSSIPRLPSPPTHGFGSDEQLEHFAKSCRLKDYIHHFDTEINRLAIRIPANEASKVIKSKELQG